MKGGKPNFFEEKPGGVQHLWLTPSNLACRRSTPYEVSEYNVTKFTLLAAGKGYWCYELP